MIEATKKASYRSDLFWDDGYFYMAKDKLAKNFNVCRGHSDSNSDIEHPGNN